MVSGLNKKPRTYRRNARKDFLNFTKKKRKSKREIRKGVRKQLQYCKRDIKIIANFLDNENFSYVMSKTDIELLEIIKQVYAQQKEMFDNKKHSCKNRIISIYQPHVRPMPRGKERVKTEFGSKIDVSFVNGFARIDRLDWESFNESTDLTLQLENYYKTYGCYPAKYLADRIYLTRANRKILEDLGIKYYGSILGRPKKKTKQTAEKKYRDRKNAAQRNGIEGKFGQGKRAYGLNKIKAKRKDTSESWDSAIVFVMNLVALEQLVGKIGPTFLSFFRNWLKMSIIPLIFDVKHYSLLARNKRTCFSWI